MSPRQNADARAILERMRVAAVALLVACQPLSSGSGAQTAQPSGYSGPPGMYQPGPLPQYATVRADGVQADPSDPQAPPPPPAPPPPAAPADKGQGQGQQLADSARILVDQHNAARAKHCAAPLTWSSTLAQVAQRWANTLRDHDCAFEHSQGKYGENLAAGTTGYMDPAAVVAMWYGEIKDYNFNSPGFSMNTGHFTQVVWKGTTQLGCGMAQCKGMDVWVCEYDPPGNWEGQYRENVSKPTCR
jgi:uncharacterized protein YkwD